jgi:hypothetical protein
VKQNEGKDVADEAAGSGTTTRFNRKESLAVKTGDLRGALKRGLALTRSCTGQQNLRLNVLSVPTISRWTLGGESANRILSFYVHSLAHFGTTECRSLVCTQAN